jgi:hypothetical protein
MPDLNLTAEDAELLASAHLDLLAAQAEGVTVLGRSNDAHLVHAAHATQSLVITAEVTVVLPLVTREQETTAA